jgi:hypothetical protein
MPHAQRNLELAQLLNESATRHVTRRDGCHARGRPPGPLDREMGKADLNGRTMKAGLDHRRQDQQRDGGVVAEFGAGETAPISQTAAGLGAVEASPFWVMLGLRTRRGLGAPCRSAENGFVEFRRREQSLSRFGPMMVLHSPVPACDRSLYPGICCQTGTVFSRRERSQRTTVAAGTPRLR